MRLWRSSSSLQRRRRDNPEAPLDAPFGGWPDRPKLESHALAEVSLGIFATLVAAMFLFYLWLVIH